jgi:outer membrane protein OmpA-like peptidoglycan-associated protein
MRVLPMSVALVAATAPVYADEPPVEARLSNELVQLGEVLFAFDKSQVRGEFADEITKIMDFAQEHPEVKLVIDAHTDPVGTSASTTRRWACGGRAP